MKICPDDGTVTLKLTSGFSLARPVLYLSIDASSPLPAALEDVTSAPKLGNIASGRDDSAFSAVERLLHSPMDLQVGTTRADMIQQCINTW